MNKKTRINLNVIIIIFIILGFSCIFMITKILITYHDYHFYKNVSQREIIVRENISLYKLLYNEIINITIPDGLCYDYAELFNRTLNTKYPELDIRWIRYMDICNDLTLCNEYHTLLLIGGYKSLCMINSKNINCISFN